MVNKDKIESLILQGADEDLNASEIAENVINYVNQQNHLHKVREFVRTFSQHENALFEDIPQEIITLRVKLIAEELAELCTALGSHDYYHKIAIRTIKEEMDDKPLKTKAYEKMNLVEVLDALLDIDYVNLGAVLAFGLGDVYEKNFNLVHSNNMGKSVSLSDHELQLATLTERHKPIPVSFKKYDTRVVYYVNEKVIKPIGFQKVNLEI